jgi:RimJ/RimL family protein N-acetyltransferase
LSASTELLVLVDADNVFPARLQPVLDLLGIQSLQRHIVAAGSPTALARLRWPAATKLEPATGWQRADLVLAAAYAPSEVPLLLITGDGDFGLLAANHPGPVLVVSGAPSGRLRAAAATIDPAVDGLHAMQEWLEAIGSRPIPPLWTPRLQLRPQSPADAERLDELFDDPEVRCLRRRTPAERGQAVAAEASYQAERGFSRFTVLRRSDDQIIGFTGLHPWQGAEDIAIGWRLGRAYWGNGYATEAATAVLGYGLSIRGLRRVLSVAYQDDTASIRVIQKLGMQLEAELEIHGRDAYRYAIGRSQPRPSGPTVDRAAP